MKRNKLYYLASPYSYNPKRYIPIISYIVGVYVRWKRFRLVSDAAVHWILKGFTFLEPIAMCHYKSTHYKMPTGYTFWKRRDRWFIRKCDGLVVLMLPGWEESEGVQDELQYAKKLGKEIYYMKGDDYALHKERG